MVYQNMLLGWIVGNVGSSVFETWPTVGTTSEDIFATENRMVKM